MNENTKLMRGLRPLDSGGIFLLTQVSKYMIQSLVIIILGFFVAETGLDITKSRPVSYVLAVLTQVILIVTPLIYSKFKEIDFLREVNFKRGINLAQAGLLVLIALFSIVAFAPLSTLFGNLMTTLGYKHEIGLPSFVDTAPIFILSLLVVAVLPGFCEEVMYRAFVGRGLRKFGILSAMLLTSLIFATAHGNLLQLVHQFFLGLVLFTVYFATRSIYASMLVHMLNNGVALTVNFVAYQTTGSEMIDLGLRGASLTFTLIGISLAGMVVLCLLMWGFLTICKKRQDKYVGGRVVDIKNSKQFGSVKKDPKQNIFTKYFDFLKYLNYSFEDEEIETQYKIPEEIAFDNAEGAKNKEYNKELLESRLEKNRRWDRNMIFLAIAFNIFILIVNIIGAFRG